MGFFMQWMSKVVYNIRRLALIVLSSLYPESDVIPDSAYRLNTGEEQESPVEIHIASLWIGVNLSTTAGAIEKYTSTP